MTPDEILAALDPEQREAAQAVTGPVCILAGAGTGKTRTVTHRAAYAVATGAVPPTVPTTAQATLPPRSPRFSCTRCTSANMAQRTSSPLPLRCASS